MAMLNSQMVVVSTVPNGDHTLIMAQRHAALCSRWSKAEPEAEEEVVARSPEEVQWIRGSGSPEKTCVSLVYSYTSLWPYSIFLRYRLAFGTRVWKIGVPERAFWVDPFSNSPKLMYFLGMDTETFFPRNKKGFWELLWAQNGGWSHQQLIFPTPDPFLGEAKKVLALPGLWGKLGFLPGSFLSLKEKGSDLSQFLS